jgi:hypothetical protein
VICGDSKNRYQKDVFPRDWTACSKYDNHFIVFKEFKICREYQVDIEAELNGSRNLC